MLVKKISLTEKNHIALNLESAEATKDYYVINFKLRVVQAMLRYFVTTPHALVRLYAHKKNLHIKPQYATFRTVEMSLIFSSIDFRLVIKIWSKSTTLSPSGSYPGIIIL